MFHRMIPRTLNHAAMAALVLAFCACKGGGDAHESIGEQRLASEGSTPPGGGDQVPPPPQLAWPKTPVVSAGNDVRLPGGGSVGPDGQFHYTLPIDVPQGRMGMAPSLSISYSSGAANGALGVGWSLDGLSAIAPCPRIAAIDGKSFPVQMDGRDALCLDGQRLLDTSEGKGLSYQTELDSYARITTFVDPVTSTRSFRVQSQNGSIRIYAQYGKNPGSNAGLFWLIDTERDLEGNAINYTYNDLSADKEPGLNAVVGVWEYSINTITYTNRVSTDDKGAQSVALGARKITFHYAPRTLTSYEGLSTTDPGPSMRYGSWLLDPRCEKNCPTPRPMDVRVSKLLSSIDVYAPVPTAGTGVSSANPVWTYDFQYQISPGTRRALLASIQKTGAKGGKSLRRSFTYASDSGLDQSRWKKTGTNFPTPPAGLIYAAGLPVYLYGDLLHNGQTFLLVDNNIVAPDHIKAYQLSGSGLIQVPLSGLASAQLTDAHIVDLDGDGVPEILAPDEVSALGDLSASPPRAPGNAYGIYKLDLATMKYSRSPTPYWILDPSDLTFGENNPPNSPLFFVDMDGTGLPTGIWQHHSTAPAGDSNCTQASDCLFFSWNTVTPGPSGTTLGAPVPFYTRESYAPGDTGPALRPRPAQHPSTSAPWAAFGVTDGSGAGVLFAGINFKDYDPSPVPPPWTTSSAVPSIAWTDRNVAIWDVSKGPADSSSNFQVQADPFDATGKHLYAEINTDHNAAFGDFDGRAAAEQFDFTPAVHLKGVDDVADHWITKVMDYDQDGLSDLVAYHVGPADNAFPFDKAYLFHWTSKGLETPVQLTDIPIDIYDFDGDGLTDMIGGDLNDLNGPGPFVYLGATKAGDRLIGVFDENQGPVVESVTYVQQPASHEASGSCGTWPVACTPGGITVVSRHDVYQGGELNANDTRYYMYGPARSDLRGRGFLGFDWIDEWEPNRPAETVTQYENKDSPLNGAYLGMRPRTITRYVPVAPVPIDEKGGKVPPKALTVHITSQNNAYKMIPTTGGSYAVQLTSVSTVDTENPATLDVTLGIERHFGKFGQGVVLRSRDSFTWYDDHGNVIESDGHTDGGVWTTKTIDRYPADTGANWLLALPRTITTRSWTPGMGPSTVARTVDFAYDPGHPARVQQMMINKGNADDSVSRTTTYARNADGAVTSTTDKAPGMAPRTTSVVLDPDEGIFPRTLTDALGHVSRVLVNPTFGIAQDAFEADGVESQKGLDDFGRVRREWNVAGTTVSTDYARRLGPSGNNLGTNVSVSGPGVVPTGKSLDTLGRTVLRQRLDFAGNDQWDVTTTSYDILGRLRSETRPAVGPAFTGSAAASATYYTYDPLDRVIATLFADGHTTLQSHTFFTATTTDPRGHQTSVSRDVDGRVELSVQIGPNGEHVGTKFFYGDFDVVSQISDPNGNVTVVATDDLGRRIQLDEPDSGTTKWSYDGFGDVLSETHLTSSSSDTTKYTPDALGRVTSVDYNDGTHTQFVWDTASAPRGIGKLASSVSQDNVQRDFTYNSRGQLATSTWTVPTTMGPAGAYTISSTYDPYGRLLGIQYPIVGGPAFAVEYTYDPATAYPTGMGETGANPPLWQVISRNADGALATGKLGNGLKETRTYDTAGRLKNLADGTGTCSAMNAAGCALSLTYGYDDDGSVQSRVDNVRNRSETYDYDSLHRLVSWKLGYQGVTTDTAYEYDLLGNMNLVTVGGAKVETNEYSTVTGPFGVVRPHALSTVKITGQPGGAYTHDDRGRQVSSPTRANVTYTDFDLPRDVTDISGNTTSFLYDAGHARVRKVNQATATSPEQTSITLGGLFEQRVTPASTTNLFYVPGTDGVLVQVSSNSDVTYIHGDKLGTASVTTSAAGAVQGRLDYDPFGKRIDAAGNPATGDGGTRVSFTGHEADDDLGLINMQGRVYDPVARHFLSADPHVTYPLLAQSYNRYSYVLNNPLSFLDPTGFDGELDGGVGEPSGGDGGPPPSPQPAGPAGDALPSQIASPATPDDGATAFTPIVTPLGIMCIDSGCGQAAWSGFCLNGTCEGNLSAAEVVVTPSYPPSLTLPVDRGADYRSMPPEWLVYQWMGDPSYLRLIALHDFHPTRGDFDSNSERGLVNNVQRVVSETERWYREHGPIHVLEITGHASPGGMKLGESDALTDNNDWIYKDNAVDLGRQLRPFLDRDAKIILSGCNLACSTAKAGPGLVPRLLAFGAQVPVQAPQGYYTDTYSVPWGGGMASSGAEWIAPSVPGYSLEFSGSGFGWTVFQPPLGYPGR